MLVLVGGIFFLRVCSSESGNDSGVRAMLWVSWVVAFVTSFVGIGMQAAYTSSQDITKFFDATAIGDVMDTKFGQAWLIRAGLLILVLPALRKLSTARSMFVNVIDAALAVFVLATFTFSGHARTGRWIPVATVLDLVHLSAAAVWLGGIAILATLLVRRVVPHDTPVVTARFSRIAAPAIVVIAISGLLQALRQTDGLDSVFDTTYGRLLLTKIGLVILIVAAASVSRHIVNLWAQRHLIPAGPGAMRAEADPEDIRELRNAVVVEVAFAVIVLARHVGAREHRARARRRRRTEPERERQRRGTRLARGLPEDARRPGPDVRRATVARAHGNERDDRRDHAERRALRPDRDSRRP